MGHRSYLLIKDQKESKDLFENNNGLSLFWLSLVDPFVFQAVKKNWLAYESKRKICSEVELAKFEESIMGSSDFDFIFDLPSLEDQDSNASKFLVYLLHSEQKDIATFYQDFFLYLESEYEEGAKVIVDIFSLSNFSGIGSFADEIEEIIEAIASSNFEFLDNWVAINVSSLSGWACQKSASEFSTYYYELIEVERKGRTRRVNRNKPSKYEDEKHFVLFSLAVLALGIYSFLLFKSGSFIWGICCVLVTLVFALFAYVFGDNSIQNWKSRD